MHDLPNAHSVRYMLQQILHDLSTLFDEQEAKAHLRIIAEHLWQRPYHAIILDAHLTTSQTISSQWNRILQDLQANIPIQIILGEAYFYGRPFTVTKNTLIPRRETEELLHHAIQRIPNRCYALDLGTGSGCLAISLRLERPLTHVEAIDISEQALHTARQNAAKHHADITLRCVDMLQAAHQPHLHWAPHQFHLIISNPPYIPLREKSSISPRVLLHEPHGALFVPDENPLLFYHAILDIARHTLHPSGCIACECHAPLALSTLDLFHENGYPNAQCIDDAQGKPRFIIT